MSEEQIFEVLRSLAEQLQTTVGELWSVLVMQAYVEGITSLVFLIILTVVFVFIARSFNSWRTEYDESAREGRDSYGYKKIVHDGWAESKIIISIIYTAIYTGACIILIYRILTTLLNPQYWALQEIMRLLGQ